MPLGTPGHRQGGDGSFRTVEGGGAIAVLPCSRPPSVKATVAQLDRLSRQAPQAVVKVTTRKMGASGEMRNLTYIGRHGKVEIETGDGDKNPSPADQFSSLAA